jgi:hypothetical protein
VLHPAFRENGYALAIHGSASRDGKGNDLDLIAVPEELCVKLPVHLADRRPMSNVFALPLRVYRRSHLLHSTLGLSDRVTSQVGQVLHLPFDDASFDVVLMRRILAPGGRLPPTTWCFAMAMCCIRPLGHATHR